jgi:hypothetical protein
LEDFAFGVPERNATRACLEIAVLLRLIEEPLAYRKWSFGVIYGTDGTTKPLTLKELTNKIIHAEELSGIYPTKRHPNCYVLPRMLRKRNTSGQRLRWVLLL